jgi:protocatechuate 3,4-dioxygenase, beta subunit
MHPTSVLTTDIKSKLDIRNNEYKSTALRAPTQPLLATSQTIGELCAPRFDASVLYEHSDDLTRQCEGTPQGERIIVHGRVLDSLGAPVRNTLVEVWQSNAAGRYRHDGDIHPAPLDPNFIGAGRVLTDELGAYCFTTIKPGAYPWKNHHNSWRPAHIHFSVFGPSVLQRLVTQMYFPGDPLLQLDPIFNSVPHAEAKHSLVARFDIERSEPEWALAYEFNIVLRGAVLNTDTGLAAAPSQA